MSWRKWFFPTLEQSPPAPPVEEAMSRLEGFQVGRRYQLVSLDRFEGKATFLDETGKEVRFQVEESEL